MPTYVTLIHYTEQGVKAFKDLPQRLEDTRKAGEAVGANLVSFYLTMGQYDAVVVSDAPDDQTVAKLALAAAGRGNVHTETLRDFTKKALRKRFASLDDFLKRWRAAERKQAIVEELASEGLPLDPLAEEIGKELDPFDLICHVAFDRPPLTRRERADNVRKRDVFTKYGPQARVVLDALLAKYQDEGVINLDDLHILQIPPFSSMGTVPQLVAQFGSRAGFESAVHELQAALYEETA